MAGAGWKYTHSVGGQGKQQGLGPSAGAQANTRASVVSMHYHSFWLSPWARGCGGQCQESGWGHASLQLERLAVSSVV